MSKTMSNMLDLGTKAPKFMLTDVVTGKVVTLDTFRDKKALLVIFMCRHCPYVKHFQDEIAKIGMDYKDSTLGIVAISANDAEKYPDDAPVSLKEMAGELAFSFPYLYDESQGVAKAYTAACTPDPFLFDADRTLVYRGQIDGSRPGNDLPITGVDLRAAIDAVLTGRPVDKVQKPSVGCSIKWKKGNEPSYFEIG
jgi:peroxiredoxin